MTKKRFSLLIDDDFPEEQEDTSRLKSTSKRFSLFDTTDNSSTEQSFSDEDDRPRLSIMDNEEEKTTERIPFSRKLHSWFLENETVFLHRTYGISLNYDNKKKIQYLLEVKCNGFKKGVFYYTLNRKRFFKNGENLEGLMEELAGASSTIIYPLKIKVNATGEFVGVTNQEDIEDRWKIKQKELAKRYSGRPFVRFCDKITKAVSSPKKLLTSLQNDVAYDLLFSNLYLNYSNTYTKTVEKKIKWFSGVQKVRFVGEQLLKKVKKENNRIEIEYKGSMSPIGTLTNGATQINYQLDGNDQTLLRLDGTFNYNLNNNTKTISFSAIYQKDRDQTEARKIEDKKERGIYIDPNAPPAKWYEFWK